MEMQIAPMEPMNHPIIVNLKKKHVLGIYLLVKMGIVFRGAIFVMGIGIVVSGFSEILKITMV